MRLLLDNNLSERLVVLLAELGWDVVHVAALGLRSADDATVLAAARDAERVLVSADTDFGSILARTRATAPSVVLVRRVSGRRAEPLSALLAYNLPAVAEDLAAGSVVVLGDESVRVRRLPIA
jgi:predicted nuclease of predicted toxin-antitoxin system